MKTTVMICVVVLVAIIGFATLGGKAQYPQHDMKQDSGTVNIPQ